MGFRSSNPAPDRTPRFTAARLGVVQDNEVPILRRRFQTALADIRSAQLNDVTALLPNIRRGALLLACVLFLAGCVQWNHFKEYAGVYPESEVTEPLGQPSSIRRRSETPAVAPHYRVGRIPQAADSAQSSKESKGRCGPSLLANFAVGRVVSTAWDAELVSG